MMRRAIETSSSTLATLGGIRLPEVEVPIALHSGMNSGATFRVVYGTHQPFDDDMPDELHADHGKHLEAVVRSADESSLAGGITSRAAVEMIMEAAHAEVPPR